MLFCWFFFFQNQRELECNHIKQHSLSIFLFFLENGKHDLKITTSLDKKELDIQSIPKFVKYKKELTCCKNSSFQANNFYL